MPNAPGTKPTQYRLTATHKDMLEAIRVSLGQASEAEALRWSIEQAHELMLAWKKNIAGEIRKKSKKGA